MAEWYDIIWQIAIPSVLGIFMFIITYNMWKSQNEKNQTDVLFKIFSLLSSPEMRESRYKIHTITNPDGKDQPLNVKVAITIRKEIDLVLSNFDQVSILVLKKKVDNELFFELYGQMLVRDYMRLKNVIKPKIDKNPRFLHHYKTLQNEFSQRTDLPETKLY